MAAQDIPLPQDPIPPEVAIAQGQREQISIRVSWNNNTIGHLLGTQNAQATLMKYGGNPKKF